MIRRQYHGKVNTPEYRSWRGMIERCERSGHKFFKNYGGKGIRVCSRWRNSFPLFLADMGLRPPGTSLERKNSNKDYAPGNCFWASRITQNNNRSNNVTVTIGGLTQTLTQWCRQMGLNYSTVRARARRMKLTYKQAIIFSA